MAQITYDHLTAIMRAALRAGELSPCETSALVEAFEGGGGDTAVEGNPNTVDSDDAAEALEKFADDLLRVVQAIRVA